ncbi:T9SS C-terminal target domain-containing protein [candidate division KSB1 bacterium]|nr:T9SS type A sorting domain-containing protein [candidate division KSB1 bacterium]RQW03153.1 MAG: T9SS C-terminal target domain-containing protein [candidate division KSB1 bacterium]
MRYLLMFLFVSTLLADEQQPSIAHLIAESEAKQALVERIRRADIQVTDNQMSYDVIFYHLDLFPDVSSKILYGDVSMRAVALKNGLEKAELDFLNNMVVDSVFFNGQPTSFEHVNNLLTINFDQVVGKNSQFTTRVVYHGKPSQSGFGAFGFDTHFGKPMIWTLSEPFGARNWWPCKDAPIDKADSVDIRVKVRSDLIVASNGNLVDVSEKNGFKTYFWQERYPIVTYLVSLAIYPYSTYSDWYVSANSDSMEVQFYVLDGYMSYAKQQNAKTVSMIETFSNIFGEYPFIKEKYGHAQFLWGGGMEHQTITSLGGYGEGLIAHELSHQWWGDMVTCEDFHHIWLNEGFATYSEALWWESRSGEAALHQDMAAKAYLGDGTIYVENPLTDNIFYYQTTYAKAAWVLHMLRHVVGDDIFFDMLKTYYHDFKFKTVNTDQFRALCESVSGLDLESYFDQWIYKSGAPFYEYVWWHEKADSEDEWRVMGVLRQVQYPHPVFEMPVDIQIKTKRQETTVVLQNNQREQPFEFVVKGEPETVHIDKNNWILKRVSQISEPYFTVRTVSVTDDKSRPLSAIAPGTTAHITFSLQNMGTTATNVTVRLSTDDADIQLNTSRIDVGEMRPSGEFTNLDQPFIVQATEDARDHLAFLQISVEYSGGASLPHEFYIPIGSPTLLIVDDDAGADYEKYYPSIAVQGRQFASFWTVAQQGIPPLDTLQSVQHVLWFTGDDSVSTFTREEQTLVADYLSGGGHLLISGQSIGYDLVEDGDEQDVSFYHNVLFADYKPDIISDIAVVGLPGDPVGDGLTIRFEDLGDGAGNQNRLRELLPVEPAVQSFFFLPSRKSAGIRYADSVSGARLVYVAFGLEGIEGPKETSAAELLSQSIQWFKQIDTNSQENSSTLPTDFIIEQNYPNPFNPATTIRFYNPERNQVQVDIYNALGQRVRTLHDGLLETGWHVMSWNGQMDDEESSASGVYFVQVRTNSSNQYGSKTVKMLKLN